MCITVVLMHFGEEYNAGRIDYRNKDVDRAHLKNLFAEAKLDDSFFSKKLCAKRYEQNYGAAVEKDADLFQEGSVKQHNRSSGSFHCEFFVFWYWNVLFFIF